MFRVSAHAAIGESAAERKRIRLAASDCEETCQEIGSTLRLGSRGGFEPWACNIQGSHPTAVDQPSECRDHGGAAWPVAGREPQARHLARVDDVNIDVQQDWPLRHVADGEVRDSGLVDSTR